MTDKPEITSIDPTTATPGTEITITGERFGETQGEGIVHVGGEIAEVVAWSEDEITVKVPAGLTPADYGVTVLTDAGASNEKEITVSGAQVPDRIEGQIEHPTPMSAMVDYLKEAKIDPTGMTFSVVKISKTDPNWKIDKASKAGQSPVYFVLHKESGNWVVKDHGTSLTTQELQADGVPADLVGPEPPPAPETQAQAIWDYIKNQGGDPTGVAVSLTRISSVDPSWELGIAQKSGQPANLVVFHKENGNWIVKAYGTSIPMADLARLTLPADLVPNQQAVLDFIKTEEQAGEPDGWTLSLTKVSQVNPDWQVVTGTKPGEGTMYFVCHWENGIWVVKDYGETLKPGAVPGEPSDLP